ncbi:MAG: LPS assembly lipoprotein LptE [Rhodovibrionaceae bacterium]|nr:LPS assembly lipoprotein LptE [Rhodovibrionaceae bacterium]
MYGRTESGPTTQAYFASTRVAPMTDRIGQQMHNLMRDRLNPQGQPAEPLYVLRIQLREQRQSLGIRRDETASRANLIIGAQVHLIRRDGRKTLLKDVMSTTASYNILDNQFATVIAERDARERALVVLADDITRRLGLFFSDYDPAKS